MVLRFAPKGHHVIAWGIAPGKRRGNGKAPTGRNEDTMSYRPVGALGHIWVLTQGVALGYHLLGLRPGVALRVVLRFAPKGHNVIAWGIAPGK